MKSFRKLFYFSLPALLALVALPAQAVCPVCIVAVGAGLGLSEYLGIDDTIAGVWIGIQQRHTPTTLNTTVSASTAVVNPPAIVSALGEHP